MSPAGAFWSGARRGTPGLKNGGVMKTNGASTRNPRRGLYVGLALTLPASSALAGIALWQMLDSALGSVGEVTAAIVSAGLVCLVGVALIALWELRARRRPTRAARGERSVPPPTEEEAAALAHAQKME